MNGLEDILSVRVDANIAPAIAAFLSFNDAVNKTSLSLRKLGASLERLPQNKLFSRTDAVNASFPQSGGISLESAFDGAISKMEEAAAIEPFSLASFGIDDLNQRSMPSLIKNFDVLDAEISQAANSQIRFNHQAKQMERLGPMFAFLFGGMQMQMLGNSILRFLLPPMEKIQNFTSKGTKRVNAMKASFEFLKFSIFDAFTATPLFRNFVEIIINASNWLSEMVTKYPRLLEIAAVIGGIASVLGTLLIGAGIFTQFSMILDELSLIGSKAGSATSKIKGIGNALKGLSVVAGVAITLDGFIDAFNILKDNESTLRDYLLMALKLAAGGALITWGLGAGGVLGMTIGLAVSFAIITFDFISQKGKEFAAKETLKKIKEAGGVDKRLNEVFYEQTAGATVVPDFVLNSWKDLGIAINDSSVFAADSINSNLVNGEMVNLNESIMQTGGIAQTEIIDRWENWTPSTKTLTIKVNRVESYGASTATAGTKSFSSSITSGR